jgi:putative peptidoglycan lipid II flippase
LNRSRKEASSFLDVDGRLVEWTFTDDVMTSPPQLPVKPPPSLLRSAGLVGLMTLISKLSGMLQSRMLAYYLGVGPAADAFAVAFRLPNLLRRFTAEGTMTAAFLPTVSETEADQGEGAAKELVAKFLGTLSLFMVFLCTLGVLGMGVFTGLQMLGRIAPGAPLLEQFTLLGQVLAGTRSAPPNLGLTTVLGRIMFPYLGLVSLTAGLAAVLNLKGRFGLPASVSTFWNLAFMAFSYAAIRLGPSSWMEPVQATLVFAVAVIIGGFVQLFMLWPAFRTMGYGIRWGLFLQHTGVRKALRRMAPGLLGTGIHPINVLVSTSLASQLAVGAQMVLFNSNMMGEMILGLFAASVATVSLPTMSRLVNGGDMEGLRDSLASALRGTAVLAIPASVGMAVLAQPIIAIIFQNGRFDDRAVQWTATTLAFQAVGLLFIATGRITAQCLYALKDYRTPAYSALLGMILNITFSILLMKPLGTGGIALANGLASLAGLGFLTLSLHRRLGCLPFRRILHGWLAMILAAGVMGLLAWYGGGFLDVFRFQGVIHASLRLFPLIALCAFAYLALLMLMGVNEAQDLVSLVKRKLCLR